VSDGEINLIETGRAAVAAVTRILLHDGTAAQCQLQASLFYEALRVELASVPEHERERRHILSAAVAHCNEIALPTSTPLFILARLKAALALLESSMPGRRPPASVLEGAPRLRLVQGGRT
jgi:hypothetical protein